MAIPFDNSYVIAFVFVNREQYELCVINLSNRTWICIPTEISKHNIYWGMNNIKCYGKHFVVCITSIYGDPCENDGSEVREYYHFAYDLASFPETWRDNVNVYPEHEVESIVPMKSSRTLN